MSVERHGPRGLQHFAYVVERRGGADVAAQHGEVLVPRDVGDLALLDACGRGRGHIPGAQGVPRELLGPQPGGLRATLDDQRDRLTGEQMVSEQYLLDLEREAFLSLCGLPKTQERMGYMLKTGKPLRN